MVRVPSLASDHLLRIARMALRREEEASPVTACQSRLRMGSARAGPTSGASTVEKYSRANAFTEGEFQRTLEVFAGRVTLAEYHPSPPSVTIVTRAARECSSRSKNW